MITTERVAALEAEEAQLIARLDEINDALDAHGTLDVTDIHAYHALCAAGNAVHERLVEVQSALHEAYEP